MTFLFFGLGSSQPASQLLQLTYNYSSSSTTTTFFFFLLLLLLIEDILNKMHVIHLSLHTVNTHICVRVCVCEWRGNTLTYGCCCCCCCINTGFI